MILGDGLATKDAGFFIMLINILNSESSVFKRTYLKAQPTTDTDYHLFLFHRILVTESRSDRDDVAFAYWTAKPSYEK